MTRCQIKTMKTMMENCEVKDEMCISKIPCGNLCGKILWTSVSGYDTKEVKLKNHKESIDKSIEQICKGCKELSGKERCHARGKMLSM